MGQFVLLHLNVVDFTVAIKGVLHSEQPVAVLVRPPCNSQTPAHRLGDVFNGHIIKILYPPVPRPLRETLLMFSNIHHGFTLDFTFNRS